MSPSHTDAEICNYTEFSAKKNAPLKTAFFRVMLAVLLLSCSVCIFIFTHWVLGCISLLLSVIVFYFLLPFTTVEYRYTISNGMLRFEKIRSSKHTDTVLELKLEDIISLSPCADKMNIPKTCDICDFTGVTEEGMPYCAVFNKDGQQCAVLFSCTSKALAILEDHISR